MIQTSEWVSLGHPDKVADYISCYILDRYLERDPQTRFALEVQIKDNFVTLAGEIASKADGIGGLQADDIAQFVRDAICEIGYTRDYQLKWGEENIISGNNVFVDMHISHQSPDIAQGVDNNGWGDQGIFWGMAVKSPLTEYMPVDWWFAKKIGMHLYDMKVGGLDIKTQVTTDDGVVRDVVVAIPLSMKNSIGDVRNVVSYCLGNSKDYVLHINGTGRFVKHGPIADAGTTGRKLAVDFYGGNCRLGGGCPWTKDGTKADLTLNLLARERALNYILTHPECDCSAVYCAISCRIGSPEILVVLMDECGNKIVSHYEVVKPNDLIEHFKLRTPRFARMCRYGLFT